MKAMKFTSENFIPTWRSKSTQELAIHTATLMTIGVYIRQSPCGIIIITFHALVLLSVLQGSWVCLWMLSGCTGFATVRFWGCHSLGYLHYYEWKLFLWRAFCPEDGMWHELAITMISNWLIWFFGSLIHKQHGTGPAYVIVPQPGWYSSNESMSVLLDFGGDLLYIVTGLFE